MEEANCKICNLCSQFEKGEKSELKITYNTNNVLAFLSTDEPFGEISIIIISKMHIPNTIAEKMDLTKAWGTLDLSTESKEILRDMQLAIQDAEKRFGFSAVTYNADINHPYRNHLYSNVIKK